MLACAIRILSILDKLLNLWNTVPREPYGYHSRAMRCLHLIFFNMLMKKSYQKQSRQIINTSKELGSLETRSAYNILLPIIICAHGVYRVQSRILTVARKEKKRKEKDFYCLSLNIGCHVLTWPKGSSNSINFDNRYIDGPESVSNGKDIFVSRSFGSVLEQPTS